MTSELFGMVPPHNFEAEQSVLGGLMLGSDAYHDLGLLSSDFYGRPHQVIFRAMTELAAARQPIDLMTVQHQLEEFGMLEEAGGLAYLVEIAKNTPSVANITIYGTIVRQAAERRFAVAKLHDCIEAMMLPGLETTDDRFAKMGALLGEIDAKRAGGVSGLAVPASDIVQDWYDEMERRIAHRPSEMTGFVTGIAALDAVLYPSGISRTALVCVGGRPKMGKSNFMAKLCCHTALVKRLPVVGFSLEMSRTELFEVTLAQASRISRRTIGEAKDQAMMDKAYAVAAELAHSQFHIADLPGMSLHQVQRESRRLHRQLGQLGLIAVDYLTLMKAEKAERNDLAYGAITKGLKELAKEMRCPVILLTQLNRGLEQRADKRPQPSDSRDTGQIEQDCDVWIGLYRDEVYHDNSPYRGLMELLVRLNRNGGAGVGYCQFSEGVISDIEPEEIARRHHLAELEMMDRYSQKSGWED
ncbi:replicative DNA helicase [Aeromonas veronii]|uniref:replicative DNA helicase n=1 Tax=Aeromonas veronii TaxID=654 RepID=UPI003BA09605